jgi:hypothetical protein
MAHSAHAYVRGNTVQFYEWLDGRKHGSLPEGPPIWIAPFRDGYGCSSRRQRSAHFRDKSEKLGIAEHSGGLCRMLTRGSLYSVTGVILQNSMMIFLPYYSRQ